MACIDVFAPGRLLTVLFLWEQIVIDCIGTEFTATEVYDFLLQVDDGEDLTEFFVGSPHFCRWKDAKGKWKDTVELLLIGDHRSSWGWFYHGDETRQNQGDKTILTLQVPNPVHPAGATIYPLDGEV